MAAALRCDVPFADLEDLRWSVLNVTGRALLPSLMATVSLHVSSRAGTKVPVAFAMDCAHRAGRSSKLGIMVSLALLVLVGLRGDERPGALCVLSSSGGEELR